MSQLSRRIVEVLHEQRYKELKQCPHCLSMNTVVRPCDVPYYEEGIGAAAIAGVSYPIKEALSHSTRILRSCWDCVISTDLTHDDAMAILTYEEVRANKKKMEEKHATN